MADDLILEKVEDDGVDNDGEMGGVGEDVDEGDEGGRVGRG